MVTGASGQLGRALVEAYADADVVALTHADMDIADEAAVRSAVREHEPDLVLNAAAYTAVDLCEHDPEPAWRTNATGPWALGRACALWDVPIVHFSTDYIFDGTSDRPYTEFDAPNPQSVYGRTKLAGEQLLRQTARRHFIVRTSWLHGAGSANFLSTMLRLGRQRGEVRVVADQRGSPTFTPDLAAAVRALAATDRYGTYHLTNAGACTWFELATAAYELAGLDVTCEPIDTATFGASAPRPANSVLDNRMAQLAGVAPMPTWKDALPAWLSSSQLR
ncbi:MAG: dTDP-4-dehydrorhamnose reductase [Actinobacteria bacterium]|nr:dTDP-4-dehydrorhamnose reductase [Actinomycetota bacterium]